MKAVTIALFVSSLVTPSDAVGFRDIVERVSRKQSRPNSFPDAVNSFATEEEEGGRQLQTAGCYGKSGTTPQAWHPNNTAGWTNGYCRFTQDCNSPAYSTQLACCKAAYAGQISGFCLMQLPNPPSTSPTMDGGLDIYYPDYDTPWPNAGCINTRPMPSGRPTYSTMLACCKGAYGGQVSGKCLSQLPSPPTASPTTSGGVVDFWYPDYDTPWTEAGCLNKFPLPYPNVNDRPNYPTNLACCKGEYSGQMSGKCLSTLPTPPTTSPTNSGGIADFWYPDYDQAWSEAGCSNKFPLPYPNVNDRPNYLTNLACCKGAYSGQVSGKCLSMLANPPTTSPTTSGGIADFWYPDYDQAWSEAGCSNKFPLPYPNINDRPNYPTNLACCEGAYGGQMSGKCLSMLANPPTTSPTNSGGIADFWYPDYDTAWSEAGCSNKLPLPYPNINDRPNYSTNLACCKAAFGGQISGKCLSMLPNPPTGSPTEAGGLDVYYPDYTTSWAVAGCINTRPMPSGRPTYDTILACCKGAYSGQVSGKCLSMLPNPPTTSPTTSVGLDVWYADYSKAWPSGVCINDSPLPSGRPTYSTRVACCDDAYGGQVMDTCQCDNDPCYSCNCPGATGTGACPSLTCS